MPEDEPTKTRETASDFRERLLRAPMDERVVMLTDRLQAEIAEQLSVGVNELSLDARLDCLSPDWSDPSLLWWSLFSVLFSALGFWFWPREVAEVRSICSLSEYVAKEMEPVPHPPTSVQVVDPFDKGNWSWDIPSKPPVGVERNPGIAFILSSPRAGSTLLRCMLAGHPRLYSPPELNLLMFESMGERGHQIDQLGFPWMRNGLQAAFGYTERLQREDGDRLCSDLEQGDVPVQHVYARLQALVGDRLLVDKSPSYAIHPEFLRRAEQLFERPKYLHLVRHPCGVIESFVRMRFHKLFGNTVNFWDENPWLFAEKVWDATNLHILDALSDVETSRQHRIVYEELVTNPDGQLRDICEFLGLPFDAGVLRPHGDDRLPGIGDPTFGASSGVDASRAEGWRKRPPPQRLGEVTCQLCREFGYEVPENPLPGVHNPP